MEPLTEDRLIDFFERHDYSCPVCHSDTWALTNPEEPLLLMLGTHDGGLKLPSRHIPCYGLICTTCGNIRTHAKIVVDDLIAKEDGDE